ncbi:high-affinity choline transporter 1-like [Macrochelys suwanniensis]
MALNIPGLVATIVFYAITLATGIWAAWKTKKEEKNANRSEVAMVGGRNMNIFVGLFTTTDYLVSPAGRMGEGGAASVAAKKATWVGGGYINGTSEIVYLPTRGLAWVVAPWTCVPFALLNSATKSIYYTAVNEFYQVPWIGKLETEYLGRWLDELLYVALGSIPWQLYFQRVLAASSSRQARLTSYFAGFGCVFMVIPSVLIGAVAASTDWNQTSYGLPTPNERGESSMILPIVLQYLCPTYVSIAGLGAIAAAVMSSADSALLSASSMLAHNIYRKILRKKATEKEVVCIMKVSMVVFGAAAAGLAFLSNSVYDLWFLSGELVYALLFPQLCCVLFIPNTNTYGSAAGFFFGFLLRLLAGEPSLKISPIIHYPGCSLVDGVYIQLFPFKTFTMLLTLGTIVAVSYLVAFLFKRNILPRRWDVCSVIKESEYPTLKKCMSNDKL